MGLNEIEMVNFADIPSSNGLSSQAPERSKVSDVVNKFFHSIKDQLYITRASELLEKYLCPPRKLVRICLGLASKISGPFEDQSYKSIPAIPLGAAAIQTLASLGSLGSRIFKSVQALKEKRHVAERLREAQKKLVMTEGTERAKLEIKIKGLQKQLDTYNAQIFTLIKVPPQISNLASTALTGLHLIIEKVGHVSGTVLAGVSTAATIAGAAAGGFAVLLGSVKGALGIRGAVLAYKEKKAVEKKLEEFSALTRSEKKVPDEIWKTLRGIRILQLNRDKLKANKHFQLSLLKACGGALATVAGALGIAAAFTSGVAALGIAVAALVVTLVGIGVSIHSYLERKRLKSEIDTLKISHEQINEVIAYIKSPDCTDEMRTEIAKILGIDIQKLLAPDINLLYDFRKLLFTKSDAKELSIYLCTGESTVHQKGKFALLLNAPETMVHDRQAFFEKVLTDIFPQIQPGEIQVLETYFRTENPNSQSKESVKKILGHKIRDLSKPQKVLENILSETLIHFQESTTDFTEPNPNYTQTK